MPLQDTAHLADRKYRGADWDRIQSKWGGTALGRGRSQAPRSGGSSPAPYRLGSRTHFDRYADAIKEYPGPAYFGVFKDYGENGAKVILRTTHEAPRIGHADHSQDPPKPINPQEPGTPRSQADPINLKRAAWRARSKIEDWVRMTCTAGKDYRLGTGTKRGGFQTAAEALQAIAKMRRQINRHYPGTEIIAVPELHPGDGINGGTYHVHMILVFAAGVRPMYAVFHRLWWRALGGVGSEKGANVPGNFDFARTHAKDGTRYTACQGARYLAKYVTKDVTAGNTGEKRFTVTHGAPDPARRYFWQPIAMHHMTRAHVVAGLRSRYAPADYMILSRTFSDGGDTFHVFSVEPVPT